MSSINHRDIRAAVCSIISATQYHQVALIGRGWWETLQQDKGYREARRLWDIYYAAKAGRRDVVELFIKRGATNWDYGMQGAARGGHKELVDLFIKQGATDWDRGMYGAAYGGHKELVEFFINRGANDWIECLHTAANWGYPELEAFFQAKLQGH